MKDKLIALGLAAAMTLSMGSMAFASPGVESTGDVTTAGGNGTTAVKVEIAEPNFTVTVPTVLVYAVDSNGTVTSPSDVKITNNSHAPVAVKNMTVSGQNMWATQDYDTFNPANEKVGAKKVAIYVNGDKTTGANAISFGASNFQVMTGKTSNGHDGDDNICEITTRAEFAPQREETTQTVANVVFTLGWDEVA